MSSVKCVVEGCNLEYDVVCSFSFYNVNTSADNDDTRQEWIEGAMQEESECLWRHVSLQLCGYHFELDAQGLWIDSPMLPELLTLREEASSSGQPHGTQGKGRAGGKRRQRDRESYQGLFEQFVGGKPKGMDLVLMEHNYCTIPVKVETNEEVTRLNVRQLVDTLGYLSLKNLQRKQLWVAKVETEKTEASITQAEQVITKMSSPKQLIEIIPPTSQEAGGSSLPESFQIAADNDGLDGDNFIYEIAEEQEITMEEVKEIPHTNEWAVNIIPDPGRTKYAYIKHCTTGKKKRHFTAEINEVTLHGDFDNYYILPDADPSVGVEITTSYEPENYIVDEYQHLVLDERPRKRNRESKEHREEKKKKKRLSMRDQVKQIKTEMNEDWTMENNLVYEQDDDDEARKVNPRVRRKNKKYLGYDFVT